GGGVPYERYGDEEREAIAAGNRPLYLNLLGRYWLPAIPDLDARLRAEPPARVADLGCGMGWSSLSIARAYPHVQVDGFDLDAPSFARAREVAAREALAGRVRLLARTAAVPDLAGPLRP